MDRVINKKMIEKLKHNVYQHRLQIILLILAFVVILNLASVSAIMYINKKKVNKTVVYENSTKFLTVYNSGSITQTQEEEKKEEEKPIVIKKGTMNDKEDGEKKYTDSSMSNASLSSIYDAISLYETDGTSVGIDVSKYQKNIDWKKVKESGVEFAIIRCGYRGYGSGEILMDPYFEQNISGALKNGIKVVAACSERKVEEKKVGDDTQKFSYFSFVQFREY